MVNASGPPGSQGEREVKGLAKMEKLNEVLSVKRVLGHSKEIIYI